MPMCVRRELRSTTSHGFRVGPVAGEKPTAVVHGPAGITGEYSGSENPTRDRLGEMEGSSGVALGGSVLQRACTEETWRSFAVFLSFTADLFASRAVK